MPSITYSRHTVAALGTFATVLVADPADLDAARGLLVAELAAIDVAASRFRPDSELSRVCAADGCPVPVSPLFAEALSVALAAAELTDGDVDPTCGQALAALGYDRDFASARQDTSPPRQPSKPGGGWRGVILDPARQQVTVPRGVLLDLGATAKALAADRAAAAIAAATGHGTLVNLGGDISVAGQPPEGGWPVGVADNATFDTTTVTVETTQEIVIQDGGLATSSVLGRAWQRGDARLHHIIDPRTGMPVSSCWRTVTVAAGSCVDANIASTAAIVRGERAVAWLERLGLPSRLVRPDGAVVTVANWPAARDAA
jgi:thiamine biosynthesis lipoprotein